MIYTTTDYQSLRDRAIRLNSLKDSSYKTYKNSEAKYIETAEKLLQAKEKVLVQEASIKVLREIIDIMSKEFIDSIVDLMTYALQTIFYDMNYSVKILLKESRNSKQAEILLVDKKEDGSIIESPIPDNCGGGITSVLGLVLQVFFIQYFKLNKILIIDEGLSQISNAYIKPTMEFMKTLSEQRDFKFMFICHDPRFIKYADYQYEMVHGKLKEVDVNGGEF